MINVWKISFPDIFPHQEMLFQAAHCNLVVSHLGHEKILTHLMAHFYCPWPSSWCSQLLCCMSQMSLGKFAGHTKSPFVPITSNRGPLWKNWDWPPQAIREQFMLVLVDYAMWYPEAMPLYMITTCSVAEALFHVVLTPKAILTDNGKSFICTHAHCVNYLNY